jgi:hypothetical protein
MPLALAGRRVGRRAAHNDGSDMSAIIIHMTAGA